MAPRAAGNVQFEVVETCGAVIAAIAAALRRHQRASPHPCRTRLTRRNANP
jgi:hypothetical protein